MANIPLVVGFANGTSPVGRPIMTQQSNLHNTDFTNVKVGSYRLFDMLRMVLVSICPYFLLVVGSGISAIGYPIMAEE